MKGPHAELLPAPLEDCSRRKLLGARTVDWKRPSTSSSPKRLHLNVGRPNLGHSWRLSSAPLRHRSEEPRLHVDSVVHVHDARRIGSRTLGRFTLQPRSHVAGQRRFVSGHRNANLTRIDVRVSAERFENAMTDVPFDSSGRDGDVVHDVAHASNVMNGLVGFACLEPPIHFPSERDVPVVDDGLHAVRDRRAHFQRTGDVGCDIRVGPLQLQPHLDVIRDGSYSAHSFRGSLRPELAGIAADKSGEGDRPASGSDANRTCVHFGIPLQLPEHGISHADIRIGQARS
jgi:hypothetical protein